MPLNPMISPDSLLEPDTIAAPFPIYRALREHSPIRFLRVRAGAFAGLTEPIYAHAFLRHADVLAVVRDPGTFSSNTPPVLKMLPRFVMLHDDPPRHTQLRRLASKAFSASKIAALATDIEAIARGFVQQIPRAEPVDMMAMYAMPMPTQVIATMLGVPREDYPSFRTWSSCVFAYVGVSGEERQKNIQALMAYFAQTIAARRKEPKDDMITAFTQADVEGEKLPDEDIIRLCALLLVAGHETTVHLVGNMLGILGDRPELYEQARSDEALHDAIIDETLRFESPVQRISRIATRDVEMSGVRIPAGSLVEVYYGGANRDPAVFEEPDVFKVHRSNREHIAFGQGTHFCLGAQLARLEAKTTLRVFGEHFASLRSAGQKAERQRVAPLAFGYEVLPLVAS